MLFSEHSFPYIICIFLKTLSFFNHLVHWKAYAIIFLTNVKRYPGIRTEIQVFSMIDIQSLVNVWSWNSINLVIKHFLTEGIRFIQTILWARVRFPGYLFTFVKKISAYAIQWTKWLKKQSIFKIFYTRSGV